jgi:glycolate oxidase
MPAPEGTGTGMAYFADLADAARAVSRVLSSGVLPVTLEFLDRVCIDAVEGYANIGLDREAGALLIFGQDGDRASIDRDMRRMAEACEAEGATQVRIAETEAEAADVLQARRAVLPALSRLAPLTILEDATVPRSRIAEMVQRIQAIAERHGLTIGTFGHAGDGNLHPTIVFDAQDKASEARAFAAFDEIVRVAIALGGSITGEHGVGSLKRDYLTSMVGAAERELMARVKAAFDPRGILNPGKAI